MQVVAAVALQTLSTRMLRSGNYGALRVWEWLSKPAQLELYRSSRGLASKPQPRKQPSKGNPLVYTGPIHYLDTVAKVDHWCGIIHKEAKHIAVDAEWRPDRVRGQDNPVALFQICFRNAGRIEAVLIHVRYTGIPQSLSDILMDEQVLKIGAQYKKCDAKLKKHFNVEIKGVFDLSWSQNKVLRGDSIFRKPFAIKDLVHRLLCREMVKEGKWTRSDWERRTLKEQQVEYAALDVYAIFAVYESMKRKERGRMQNKEVPNKDSIYDLDTQTVDHLPQPDR